MSLAAAFVFCASIILTLSPAARLHSWAVTFRWDHWIGFIAWLVLFAILHRQTSVHLPERDPYLLPLAALLSGWGLLTIWRLNPALGLRQTAWLAVSLIVLGIGLRVPLGLQLLRRYKYFWLTAGLLLTTLTFFFGTYPEGSGAGPRLWFGCCGLYFQPSEPLKLLLIVYLAAYLSGYEHIRDNLAQLMAPTLAMAGLALILLIAQRDLGTATLFIFIFTMVLYIASGSRRVLVISGLLAVLAAILGLYLFDVVRLRVAAWLNPWLDPSGRSYQIVQSLMAIANGGIIGRGIGLGSPGLVPVAQSDFIFSAIAEETGLLGALGLLLLQAFLAVRGIRAALNAPDTYQRYLAAGLTAYLISQSVLIVGGNLRLLPLTGVTLPFVSYGGSSLLTAFVGLLILLHISNHPDQEPVRLLEPQPYLVLGRLLLTGLTAAGLIQGWWSIYRAPALLSRSDNPRRSIADRYVRRGSILDRDDQSINVTQGSPGSYTRAYSYPSLSPVTGYTNPIFGQAGLEDSLDPALRGLEGYPTLTIWWDHLLYGQPPPGLDIRLSLDLTVQQQADTLLGNHRGSIVLLNASTGEILAMASHPNFDPTSLDQEWDTLRQDPEAPLINRAVLGQYPPGTALGPFLLALDGRTGDNGLPGSLAISVDGQAFSCPQPEAGRATWQAAVASGCPAVSLRLAEDLGPDRTLDLLSSLGFFTAPEIPLLVAQPAQPDEAIPVEQLTTGLAGLTVSPLQMALAASTLSAEGERPVPRLVMALNLPGQGWQTQSIDGKPTPTLTSEQSRAAAIALADPENTHWRALGFAQSAENQLVTWYLAGSLPGSQAAPLALVVLLEENNPQAAQEIGDSLLQSISQP